MIPLALSIRLAFKHILNDRIFDFREPDKEKREQRINDSQLTDLELYEVHYFLEQNCPAYTVEDHVLRLLFKSYQRKRIYKKIKQKKEQLSLYS